MISKEVSMALLRISEFVCLLITSLVTHGRWMQYKEVHTVAVSLVPGIGRQLWIPIYVAGGIHLGT